MKLTEMLGQYEELLDKKDQLAKDTKDNNAAIDKLKAEIAEMMIDEDIPSQGYGDYIYSLQDKVKYSKRGEAYLQERGLDFFEVLREQGLGELIKETVNAGSLQSAMKEIAEENDGELPPELDEVVSSYEMTDIARRKSTNKALESERELEENVNIALGFACKQVKETSKSKVSNRHDGYGIASEFYAGMKLDQKKVDESMKDFLRILPTEDDAKAVEAASSLKNAATGLVLQATKLAAQADRIMHDLYEEVSNYTTPVEDYLEGQFEDAEADPEAEAEEEQEDAE